MTCDNLDVLEGSRAKCDDAGQRLIEYGTACNGAGQAGNLVKKLLAGCEIIACSVDDQPRKDGWPARSPVGLL